MAQHRPPDPSESFGKRDNRGLQEDDDYAPSSPADHIATLSPDATQAPSFALSQRPRVSSQPAQRLSYSVESPPKLTDSETAQMASYDILSSGTNVLQSGRAEREEQESQGVDQVETGDQADQDQDDDCDISDFGVESNDEELMFASEEEQMQARYGVSQEQLSIPVSGCQDIGQLQKWDEQEHEEFVRLVRAIPEDGQEPLIRRAIDVEAGSGSSLGVKYQGMWTEWRFNSFLTLCSMNKKVIGELTYGNLALAVQRDYELRERLEKYQERSKVQPSIYARVLVAQDDSRMSARDALRLVKWLKRYISEDLFIVQHEKCRKAFWLIDREFSKRWSRESTDAGLRRSLVSKPGEVSKDRVQVIKKFTDQLHARRQGLEDNTLLPRPLLYIGYAATADIRKRQHEACGSSSNWLASLVQAVCNVLWGRGKYMMKFFVICPISEEPQGPVAEMLLTRVTGAYYHGGSGFCIDIAGKSMESIHFKKLSHIEARDLWAEHDEWVEHNTPVNENWNAQSAVTKAKWARYESRREANEKLREEMADDIGRILFMADQVEPTMDPSMPGYEEVMDSISFCRETAEKIFQLDEEQLAAEGAEAAAAQSNEEGRAEGDGNED
ncbi:hypothetical protein E8E13_008414 [Curvularia kusanoi]|uniref:Uncharacterized protein n=1 Tax=Curvularia kusanoi TaxID=90978 RepID=A0A9P4TIP5_CURKU|nr:hypothetical protein E8E13_008414 [Curvularia kusanoi]